MPDLVLTTDPAAGNLTPPPLSLDENGQLSETQVSNLNDFLLALATKIQGLTLGDGTHGQQAGNLSAQYVSGTCPAVANTEFPLPHGLGRVPAGYVVVNKDRAVDVYNGPSGRTSSVLYLKATVASAFVTLWIF